MNPKSKQNHSKMLWTIFFVVVLFGVGLGKIEKANAGYCVYVNGPDMPKYLYTHEYAKSEKDCNKENCPAAAWPKTGCTYTEKKEDAQKLQEELQNKLTVGGEKVDETGNLPDICEGMSFFDPTTWFNCLLIYILRFFSYLLSAAAGLFAIVVDPEIFLKVVNNEIIYGMWAKVRDVLNIAFILTLLFSAFATVFGVDKFSYKKILMTLIIMALLVNFSFPIARVIIDFSNVVMYYFVDALGIDISSKDSSIFAKFAEDSGLSKIVSIRDAKSDTSFLIAAVVFTFIFTITLLIIAVLFLIRIVALAILVIFSPVAFVGSIVPFLSSQASKWWDALFKYSFFGPIMMFGIYISIEMMKGVSELKGKLGNITEMHVSSGNLTELITAMAFFFIPIVILWASISFAQSMSIAGAGAVVGRGRKFMNWAGAGVAGNFSGYNWANRRFKSYQKERQKRRDESLKGNIGEKLGKKFNKAQDDVHGSLSTVGNKWYSPRVPGSRAARKRIENMHSADVREYMKDVDNITNADELANRFDMAASGAEKEAILRRAASIGETASILNRSDQTNDRTGLRNFMIKQFGDNDSSAKLTSAIAGLEAAKHNTQYGGTAIYDKESNRYIYSPEGKLDAKSPAANIQFAMSGGEHAQNVARNLRPGFIVTQGAGGKITGFNSDFENFLENIGEDFNNKETGLTTKQIDQIPNSVIRQMQAAIDAGAPVTPGSRTSDLIAALQRAGRLR